MIRDEWNCTPGQNEILRHRFYIRHQQWQNMNGFIKLSHKADTLAVHLFAFRNECKNNGYINGYPFRRVLAALSIIHAFGSEDLALIYGYSRFSLIGR